jgi:hypothetical protein
MTFAWNDDVLACDGPLTVEDAETLLQELVARPGARADLSACGHVHAAALQVLMAARVRVEGWPADAALAAWLRTALDQH